MTVLQRCIRAFVFAFFLSLPVVTFMSADGDEPLYTWDISATEDDSVFASLHEISLGEYRLEINGEGKMKNFSDFTPPWFQYTDSILFAHIGRGVKNLGSFTFNYCFNLEKIVLEEKDIILPADIFPIPDETAVYAHVKSSVKDYLSIINPERFYPLCEFDNSVCAVCLYECTDHKGGEADCTSGALCEICGTEYESQKGHDLGDIIPEAPSDCAKTGMMAYYSCTRCGLYFDSEKNSVTEESLVIPIKHKLGDLIPYSPPMCTEYGIIPHCHCEMCGANFDENGRDLDNIYLPALDHSGGRATCTSGAICDVCGKAYGEIDATNHNFSEQLRYDRLAHRYECDCGEVKESSEHSFSSRISKPQTVEEEGIKEYSCICGYKYEEPLPKLTPPAEKPIQPASEGDKTVWIFLSVGIGIAATTAAVVIAVVIRKRNKEARQC